MVVEDSAGAGAPGGPAGPGTGTGTTVVEEDGAGAVLGGFTTVVLRSQALSAATAAINAARCMSLLFICGTPGVYWVTWTLGAVAERPCRTERRIWRRTMPQRARAQPKVVRQLKLQDYGSP